MESGDMPDMTTVFCYMLRSSFWGPRRHIFAAEESYWPDGHGRKNASAAFPILRHPTPDILSLLTKFANNNWSKKLANKNMFAFLPHVLYDSLPIAAAALQTLTVFVPAPGPGPWSFFHIWGKVCRQSTANVLAPLWKNYFMTNTLSLWTCFKLAKNIKL